MLKKHLPAISGISLLLLICEIAKAQTPIFTPSMTPICSNVCDSPPGEDVINVIDGDLFNKFLDFEKTNTGFYVNTGTSSRVTRIDITTADDSEERDPVDFTIEGSQNGTAWTAIATDVIPCIPDRNFTRSFNFSNTASYSWYRITFSTVCDPLAANSFQIAEVQLFGDITLPIKLVSFTSQFSTANNASLQWVIAQPEDGGIFDLQRSTDGRNFTTINHQTGNATATKFSFTDPTATSGTWYYRLMMTDIDRKITYSSIALLRRGGKEVAVTVYPNPVKKGESVQLSINNAKLESWKLINTTGTTLAQKTNLKIEGSTNLSLPVIISPGIYYLQLQTDKGTMSQKIIIQ